MPKRIPDLPEADRPREKLQKNGAEALSDLELLSILIGSGTSKSHVTDIAKKIIHVIDEKGIRLAIGDLTNVDGIGVAKASTIIAAFEFVRRRIKPEGIKIKQPIDVLQLIQHYADRPQEHFIAISVNGANEVMNIRVVTIGLVNQSQVHPREIFADIIIDRACAIIIAHNHPSGNLTPSKNDVLITEKIKAAGQILGINLLDHIIFGKKGYYSFLEQKQL
ncbi:DNA repair protein RadC [uncultured Desulfobacter sp.]|uniref:RadC family protein n=1 Tax=uncultured Desulfobacter sp. TaxID=240139 RepID=UPI002AABD5A8|nr:DNA repair protein RadC [uncultured Desulfobacter sp.]